MVSLLSTRKSASPSNVCKHIMWSLGLGSTWKPPKKRKRSHWCWNCSLSCEQHFVVKRKTETKTNKKSLPCALSHLNLKITLSVRQGRESPHFKERQTEAQSGYVTSLKSQTMKWQSQNWNPDFLTQMQKYHYTHECFILWKYLSV